MDNNIQIKKTPTEIIDYITAKIELQNKTRHYSASNPIDYRKFKINQNKIIIEKAPSIFNPFQGLGTISLEISDYENSSKVKVEIDSYAKFGFVFFLIVFIMFSIPILIISQQSIIRTGLFLLAGWTPVFGFVYLGSKYNGKRLEHYSQSILKDLEIE